MAVVALKSALVTNSDAAPRVLNDVTVEGGRLREMAATIVVTNGDSIGSTFRMFRVKSNWRISEILLQCDAITSAAADIGLYKTADAGGAVVDVDAYATAQSIATAITTSPVDVAVEARNITAVAQRVWQDAGLTSDPQTEYDVALTLTAAATATGDVTLKLRYVSD